jgi:hypothetical protein
MQARNSCREAACRRDDRTRRQGYESKTTDQHSEYRADITRAALAMHSVGFSDEDTVAELGYLPDMTITWRNSRPERWPT